MDRQPRTSILPPPRVLDYHRERLEGEMSGRGIAFSAEDSNSTLLARLLVHAASCPERIVPLLASCLEAPVTNESVSRWALANLNVVVAPPRQGRSRMEVVGQVVTQLCLRGDLPLHGAGGRDRANSGNEDLQRGQHVHGGVYAGGAGQDLPEREDLPAREGTNAGEGLHDGREHNRGGVHAGQAYNHLEGPRQGWTFGSCPNCMDEGRGPLTRILYHVCGARHS